MFQWYPTSGEVNKAREEGCATVRGRKEYRIHGPQGHLSEFQDKEETIRDNLVTVLKPLRLGEM